MRVLPWLHPAEQDTRLGYLIETDGWKLLRCLDRYSPISLPYHTVEGESGWGQVNY